jgi:hypothetical protein
MFSEESLLNIVFREFSCKTGKHLPCFRKIIFNIWDLLTVKYGWNQLNTASVRTDNAAMLGKVSETPNYFN